MFTIFDYPVLISYKQWGPHLLILQRMLGNTTPEQTGYFNTVTTLPGSHSDHIVKRQQTRASNII